MKQNDSSITIIVITSIIILFLLGMIIYTIYKNNIDIQNNSPSIEPPPLNKPKEENSPTPVKEPQKKIETITEEEEITHYSTEILDRKGNRLHNIKLASEKLNNAEINPGDTFSFNERVGKMGEAQGYKKAESFKTDGTKFLEFGGGICQISSTLYNTVLDSNLEVVERHPHSRRVYYVPKDRDATVYYGHKDFKFKNNTENKIKIIAEATDTTMTIKLIKLVPKQVEK